MRRAGGVASLGLVAAVLFYAALLAAAPAERAEARPIALGAYLPDVSVRPRQIDHYSRLMGRQPVIASYYKQWDQSPFRLRELRGIWRRGSVPMITWEPMSYRGRRYPLRGIARGRYDGYVRRSARVAARWGKPILLRFAHEMNGRWYAWGPSRSGNTPRRYRRAWRRVVRIFRQEGAANVRWAWTPYVDDAGRGLRAYFPGDRWVDWVGLDGFNWGYGRRFRSFRRIFGPSYRVLTRISNRPLMIAETGSGDLGKARWIRQALVRQAPRFDRIRAIVWFNHPVNGVDLRFSRPKGALRAFRHATRSPIYGAGRDTLLWPDLDS